NRRRPRADEQLERTGPRRAQAGRSLRGSRQGRPPPLGVDGEGTMSTISAREIQRDPEAFLRRIEAGESILVVKDEHPLAEVRPVQKRAESGRRPYGLCAGQFTVPDDFDQPLPDDVLDDFEGK